MASLSIRGIPDEMHLALKIMAAEERTTLTALVEEAIELLFAMRGEESDERDSRKGRGKK